VGVGGGGGWGVGGGGVPCKTTVAAKNQGRPNAAETHYTFRSGLFGDASLRIKICFLLLWGQPSPSTIVAGLRGSLRLSSPERPRTMRYQKAGRGVFPRLASNARRLADMHPRPHGGREAARRFPECDYLSGRPFLSRGGGFIGSNTVRRTVRRGPRGSPDPRTNFLPQTRKKTCRNPPNKTYF